MQLPFYFGVFKHYFGKRPLAASYLSVRPCSWNISDSTARNFVKLGILSIFRNHVEKIQVLLKSDKNNGYE
jgi:hypothetical protein